MYAVAKHTMETLVETLRDQYGRDAIVIRLGSIYGPGEFSRQTRPNVSLIGRMVREAVKNGRISVPESGRSVSWTFAPDIGRAAEALLRSPRLAHHLYNAVSGEVFTPQAIAHEIKNILPDTELAVQPVAIEAPPRQGYLANDRLQQEIGFDQWTGLADGLRQTITYFQEHEGMIQ
jgi:nucleoside-diphosphate-sugar epimerase